MDARTFAAIPAVLLLALAATVAVPSGQGASTRRAATSELDRAARRILAAHCFVCHGHDAEARQAELRLDTAEGLATTTLLGAVVVPGDPAASALIQRISASEDRMPPPEHGPALAADEIDVLRRWIESGAAVAEHWSFAAPVRPEVPKVSDPSWCRSPLDAFVQERLDALGLAPSPEADRAALLRRVSLDLVGLPPTRERMLAFLGDERPDAYERLVDELLADPGYGERWASVWLDLARYADTCGYGMDSPRTIWPWRDWVVDALNRNVPYDRFTVLQLAGDLIAEADDESRLATAFHRNALNNTEGGTDDEEFRTLAVKDRVDVTMQVWMGLTSGCARCHDHKFDPISQSEYYALYDIFNQTADTDRDDEVPLLDTPTEGERAEYDRRVAARDAAERGVDQARENTLALVAAQRGSGVPVPIWRAAAPVTAALDSGGAVDIGAESVGTRAEPAERDVWRTRFALPAGEARAFALTWPSGAATRNAALESYSATRTRLFAHRKAPMEREVALVRIELPGLVNKVALAEVEVMCGDENVATLGRATQSSTAANGEAERAIDGERGGTLAGLSLSQTDFEADPWWELELAEPARIDRVVIWNRTDGEFGALLQGARLRLLDADGATLWYSQIEGAGGARSEVALDAPLQLVLAHAFGIAHGFGGGGPAPLAVLVPAWLPPDTTEIGVHVVRSFDGGPVLDAFGFAATSDEPLPLVVRALCDDVFTAALERMPAERTAAESEAIDGVLGRIDARYHDALGRRIEARYALASLAVTRTPVMVELGPSERRASHVHVRGNFLARGAPVAAGVPERFEIEGRAAPTDRLALAHWLVDPANPLVARVAVNRSWSRLFGRGIVLTEEDFGTQGAFPTHPELLDWLALEFVESGWDTKALLRTLVTSATYRQTSRCDARRAELDPDARFLSRMPRVRLEAEMVRDAALHCSGLLVRELGGPPVFPPQPAGLWQVAFDETRAWTESTGTDRYRRDLYTYLRRSIPYHTRTLFDGTSRETCTLRRLPTNTPLQALVGLNDPVFVECAQAFARRLLGSGIEAGGGDAERLALGLEIALARPADQERIVALGELLARARSEFALDPEAAALFAEDPLGPLADGLDPVEAAAWTLVAQVLLNQDSFLTKE